MSKTLWIAGAGAGLTWTSCFSTELNSLANLNYAVGATVIANGTALDQTADISFSLTATTGASGVPYIALYILPLNQDGTTYGDNTASGAVLPSSSYLLGNVFVPLNITAAAIVGNVTGFVIPPGSFKFGLVNATSSALGAASNTVKYRTYDVNLAG